MEGHLFVQSAEDRPKEQAKRYNLVMGNESFLINDNGYWMLPVRGFIPTRHHVEIQDTPGKYLDEFTFVGPWPVLSALHVSDYLVVDHTYRQPGTGRVETSRVNRPDPLMPTATIVAGASVVLSRFTPNREQPLRLIVHLEGLGDVGCWGNDWCGTRGESRRLEGFSVTLPQHIGDVRLSYLCHVEGKGDIGWLSEGEYCGTRDESRRVEGLSFRLEGSDAGPFTIAYQAYVHGIGDTQVFRNGQFAGTRGESQIEAIRVWLERRT